ncbi:thioesterase-like superfamily-domain-containing protein [Halteromyces radiatus]|uniref:thioesterase-like superfamily-domain-containing protein n=1 Tax=Halteromyces radiatus TaxID=101107 RepID=UPI00222102E2|nr:thioesterase-like superfamily-domain-containing protein [Halteromyces radiatus]KAI8096750.1 thioesterase-like superfamily-domain-containing protein [Halteromyces radiatus]
MELSKVKEHTYLFDRGTNTTYLGKTPEGSHIYSGETIKEFAIGEVANGGYVLSVMFDSVLRHYSTRYQVDPIALNCFFLRKTDLGSLVVEVSDIKVSRKGYCLTKAVIKQPVKQSKQRLEHLSDYHPEDYVEKVYGVFTMGNMDNEEGLSADHDLPSPPNNGDRTLTLHQGEYLKDIVVTHSDASLWPVPDSPQPMEVHQTTIFRDGRPIDAKSLAFWCDMFVSPPNMLGPSMIDGQIWCATMQMEIQFKQKCHDGLKKIASSFVTHTLKNSRFDIDGWIWDDRGELLVTTRHQCLCLPWERNIKSKL